MSQSPVTITYIGHSAILIEGSKKIIIDPFLTGNPSTTRTIADIPHVDFVLVTHDHFDHFGQAVELATRDKATLVSIHEIATSEKVTNAKIDSVGMNIGGTYTKDGIKITMTDARHSSSVGSPVGFVVNIDGVRIYDSGDTALFSDMALIAKLFGPIDCALLPIGGHYVMDTTQAILAAEYLHPAQVIPIHYNTWPIINADPMQLKNGLPNTSVTVLSPGEHTVVSHI